MAVTLVVDGVERTVDDDSVSLLVALREHLGITSPKDGCSPQGQCGCCTVLVDGSPRVSCVTAVRRVAGRSVTTVDGLDPAVRSAIAGALASHGGSQCGFCTPGIVCRLAGLGPDPARDAVTDALLAHLCRCTGWQGVVEAALAWRPGDPAVAPGGPAAHRRAAIEGAIPQIVGPDAALGLGGFADDTAPAGCLAAVPDDAGGWATAPTVALARAAVGRSQGRRSGDPLTWPIDLPAGEWAVALQTTWVEPAYLEPDASWCAPGGEPAPAAGNGGAFGGKTASPALRAAQELAAESGSPARVVFTREDVVRLGPKRPPVAIGLRADGTGVARVARTSGIAAAIAAVAPAIVVEEVDVAGPPTSSALRAAGWAEAAVVLAALRGDATITAPSGTTATAEVGMDGDRPARVTVEVRCGEVLDATVLRSYAVGAAHMALGWVCSEGIAVDAGGVPTDLTMRSFGILRARDTPPIEVELVADDGPPVNGSDAVFAAVAAATWLALGLPPRWPAWRA